MFINIGKKKRQQNVSRCEFHVLICNYVGVHRVSPFMSAQGIIELTLQCIRCTAHHTQKQIITPMQASNTLLTCPSAVARKRISISRIVRCCFICLE